MKSLVAETLSAWREAERVLLELPADSTRRLEVTEIAGDLRVLHHRLIELPDPSDEALLRGRAQLHDALGRLDRARQEATGQ
ncbi:MAG TPA: hypothetical protein VMP67_09700 [Candidatus Limnocylindria bacterium]|nr:hypothetical protein [Candidatus Limnocylindria bacterium]